MSLRIGENALRQLTIPSTDKLCQGSKKKLDSCLENNAPVNKDNIDNNQGATSLTIGESNINNQCQAFYDTLEKCRNAVVSAYQQANMGGCVKEVASLSVCTVECEEQNEKGSYKETEECLNDCQKQNGVKSVNECIIGLLNRNFLYAGLQNHA